MAIDTFRCSLRLKPVWWLNAPMVTIALDEEVRWSDQLRHELDLDLSGSLSRGDHVLHIELSGKTNSDTQGSRDMAVLIENIDFFGICDDRFKWQATYQPNYPEPWYSQQVAAGLVPQDVLQGCTYLGWNGTWRLEFSTPIFTWMHRVLDLGWIYP